MTMTFTLHGWMEHCGVLLGEGEIRDMVRGSPASISRCGGEFLLEWDGCLARDHLGVMPGESLPGTIVCDGRKVATITPEFSPCGLEEAILEAVRLRSGEGAVAFSGGVDSTLVAHLAGLECVTVGVKDSHDLVQARKTAALLDLRHSCVELTNAGIEEALRRVLEVIPQIDPVNASIATTLYFVARWAGEQGYRRILAGQGADELFGGYARYLSADSPADEIERDIAALPGQIARDQAVAGLFGTWFSLPYGDARVVHAARSIPAWEKMRDGVRKIPLRRVAERHIPHEIAWYEKKAMQYGSGVMKVIKELARQNGYKKSVQGYLIHLGQG